MWNLALVNTRIFKGESTVNFSGVESWSLTILFDIRRYHDVFYEKITYNIINRIFEEETQAYFKLCLRREFKCNVKLTEQSKETALKGNLIAPEDFKTIENCQWVIVFVFSQERN